MFFPRRIFVFFPVQPLPKFSNTLLSVPEHKGYITMRWVNRNQMSFKPNMLPNRLRCFCPESGACTFMWQTNSTETFPFSRKIGQNGNKVCVSFISFSYAEGLGSECEARETSAIWGKLGTALHAYALNPCTKFPPNPTSRKVNT